MTPSCGMTPLTPEDYLPLVERALAEDVGPGDATALSTVPADARAVALMHAREPLVLAGGDVAEAVFRAVSADLEIARTRPDGEAARAGQELMRVSGSARAILTAERTALNFIQRLSGVATLTRRYVTAVEGTGVKILDTRKTTPGWRKLEKYAVACGGGRNHRVGLFDLVMVKDNHLAALVDAKPNAIAAAVAGARAMFPDLEVEVEADNLDQVRQAVTAGADIILLDNMPPDVLREAVGIVAGKARTEASGGITLDTLRAVAETGVDYISVGALTHSARAVDIALDFELK